MQSEEQHAAMHPAVEQMQTDGATPGIQDPSKPFTLCVSRLLLLWNSTGGAAGQCDGGFVPV